MSIGYSIEIKLSVAYTPENIFKILQRGEKKDFIYYDQITYEEYLNVPEINAEQATKKVWNAYMRDIEGGPCVFTVLEKKIGSNTTLRFTKSEEGSLIFRVSALESTRKKEYYLDFDFYIRMFLDVVEDFTILELKTHMF